MKTQGSSLVVSGFSGIKQPVMGKMAITQPFLDEFWFLVVQIDIQGTPLSHVYSMESCIVSTGKWP